jgi:hypothetical protein
MTAPTQILVNLGYYNSIIALGSKAKEFYILLILFRDSDSQAITIPE